MCNVDHPYSHVNEAFEKFFSKLSMTLVVTRTKSYQFCSALSMIEYSTQDS